MSDRFTVTATDGAARAGALRTAHGEVPTPAFMPVGTKATVKTLDPDELRALGARPAVEIVARRLRERGARGVSRASRVDARESGESHGARA